MARTSQKRAHRRALDRHGRDLTITQYSFGSENAYDDKSRSQDSSSTVTGRVVRSRQGEIVTDASGEDHTIDVEIIVKDSVTVSDTAPQTEFTVDGNAYRVVVSDTQDNGLITAQCRRL